MPKIKTDYAKKMTQLIKRYNASPKKTAEALNERMAAIFTKPIVIRRQVVSNIASGKTETVEARVYKAMGSLRNDELGVQNG